MHTSTGRQALVLVLIAIAGVAGIALRGQERPAPTLPPIDVLAAGSGWQAQAASSQVWSDMVYRQWLLRDVDGIPALLYLGATSRTQTMMRWSGELGFEGSGYMVARRGERALRTSDRQSVTVGTALVVGPADRRIIEYAVADPEGVIPRGTSSLAGEAWNMLRGRAGPYYVVRTSVTVRAEDAAAARTADQLLAIVLPRVLAQARSS